MHLLLGTVSLDIIAAHSGNWKKLNNFTKQPSCFTHHIYRSGSLSTV